jgi:hypothetical protein
MASTTSTLLITQYRDRAFKEQQEIILQALSLKWDTEVVKFCVHCTLKLSGWDCV